MKDTPNAIFRVAALRHYRQAREQAVLPRFVAPRVFLFLWILLGLLLLSGLAAWFVQVPVYASGQAVVLDGSDLAEPLTGEAVIVAFLPPEDFPRLRTGQPLLLREGRTGERVSRPILVVEPRIYSPGAAQRHFALPAGAAQTVSQPAAVVLARFEPASPALPAAAYVGSTYRADVPVGSRRLLSLLPVVGPLLDK